MSSTTTTSHVPSLHINTNTSSNPNTPNRVHKRSTSLDPYNLNVNHSTDKLVSLTPSPTTPPPAISKTAPCSPIAGQAHGRSFSLPLFVDSELDLDGVDIDTLTRQLESLEFDNLVAAFNADSPTSEYSAVEKIPSPKPMKDDIDTSSISSTKTLASFTPVDCDAEGKTGMKATNSLKLPVIRGPVFSHRHADSNMSEATCVDNNNSNGGSDAVIDKDKEDDDEEIGEFGREVLARVEQAGLFVGV
ncbi:unnamed protein product [Ambrosiozyma monospora]|uniref:Unnamed protein product n=1 Tax=Ambrosiozyma monospora TaxID=43982 RepID=A0ACB5T873_AMBMO|nr:unnamed protein product [Ambrosiozyma monospora]